MPSPCPEGKVINPVTGRCVKADGKIGKKVMKTQALHTPRAREECPSGKIINPATGRCVNVDGKIGKSILSKQQLASMKLLKTVKSKTKNLDKKQLLLRKIKQQCNNDTDPISFDKFEDLSEEQLLNVVEIGVGDKKHCYLLDNIYGVYETAVKSNKKPKDPLNPSHYLTDEEIADIDKKKKAMDKKYKPPKYEELQPYPPGYELSIIPDPLNPDYYHISIMLNGNIKFNLGIVPAWVETIHVGSSDYTSGVLLANIRELWDKGLMLKFARNTRFMRFTFVHFRNHNWKQSFIALCDQVSNALIENYN